MNNHYNNMNFSLNFNTGGVCYFATLLACIRLSSFYKQIDDQNTQKTYGAGLGLLVIFIVCGWKIVHAVILVSGNAFIIKCCQIQYIHHVSLAYTLIYMMYLHGNEINYWATKYVFEALSLRSMGVAFTINRNFRAKEEKTIAAEVDPIMTDPHVVDIICFTFNFIGIHKGPYYRYKVYHDHFSRPFGKLGNCKVITLRHLRNAAICSILYGGLYLLFSPYVYYEDEFYQIHGMGFRLLYNVPMIIMFFLHYQVVFFLCLSVFSETGLGVYPAKTMPWPGYGPSVNIELIKQSLDRIDVAADLEFNYNVLTSFDYKKLLLGPRMRHTLRGWDVTVRYWFWTNMYMSFIKSNHEVRSACSFVAWTLWNGSSVVQIIVAITFWVYIHLESEYGEFHSSSSPEVKPMWDVVFSISRAMCLLYMAPCFIVEDSKVVMRYYNSCYWIFHVIMLSMMVSSILVHKNRGVTARPPTTPS